MEDKKKAKLVEGAVGKTLFRLGLPMFIGILSIITFNLVDTYFVGQLGTKELAAISFTFPVILVLSSISLGLGTGSSSIISQAIGVGDQTLIKRLTSDSLMLSLIIVVIVSTIGIFTIEPLFTLMGATPDVIPLIREYMVYWYIGVPFLVIPMTGNSAIRATGDTKTPTFIMLFAMLVNLIMDPLLIFGIGPFPRLELKGAALATIIARVLSLIVSLYILIKREKMITFVSPGIKEVLLSWKKILYIGMPAAANNLIVPVSLFIITRLVSGFGKEAVAAFGVASRIEAFTITPFMALASVTVPFIGQNWGGKLYDRVRVGITRGHTFAMIWGLLAFIVYLLLANPISRLFNDNPEVTSIIAEYLVIVSMGYGFQGILMSSNAAFNAINKPMQAFFVNALRMFILYLPLAWLASKIFGLDGIFYAALAANVLSGGVAYFWVRKVLEKSISAK